MVRRLPDRRINPRGHRKGNPRGVEDRYTDPLILDHLIDERDAQGLSGR
jgi:hypothetical protein